MSRRHKAEKREVIEDAKFGDLVLAKFMNSIMYDGKKSVAETIVYGALDIVEQKLKSDPLQVFKQALENVAPAKSTDMPDRFDRLASLLDGVADQAHAAELAGDEDAGHGRFEFR